jgi:hypothetical protein
VTSVVQTLLALSVRDSVGRKNNHGGTEEERKEEELFNREIREKRERKPGREMKWQKFRSSLVSAHEFPLNSSDRGSRLSRFSR